ncbi:MAG TPA: hypothetical protein VIM61_01355 [Chthoniobacterales bacterium]
MKKFPPNSTVSRPHGILARVEVELTAVQLDAIRGRTSTRHCSEEEYLRRLVGDAMLQSVLMMHLNFSND